ncbi:MAG: zinc ribbon domain-containing protein [Thermodesulfobacteriota bacterium]
MPIYEYECTKCGQVFEELVRNSESRINCPKCGSGKAKKLISAPRALESSKNPLRLPSANSGCGAKGFS